MRFYLPCTMWWYSCAYMVKLIFPYQHKSVAGQNRLELHNMLDHILFRWRRGKYLISAWNGFEQNRWLSSNKEIVLLGVFSFVVWIKWSVNSWQNDDFLICRTVKTKKKFCGQTETSDPTGNQSLWRIIPFLGVHSVSLCSLRLRWHEVVCVLQDWPVN